MLYEKKVQEETFDNYDFEERAAIREYDAGYPRDVAEFLARDEIEARIAQQNCLSRKQNYKKEQQQNEQKKSQQPFDKAQDRPEKKEIQALQDQRDEVGKKMRAETNEQRKDKLMAEWLKLTSKIIELRKEA